MAARKLKKAPPEAVDSKLLCPVRGKSRITLAEARAIVKKVSKLPDKK